MPFTRSVVISRCRFRRSAARAPLALLAVAGGWLVSGCSSDEAGGATLPERRAAEAPPPPPVIESPSTPYTPVQVLSDGWVAGVVRVAGATPADTTVRPTMDRRVCGTSFVDRTLPRTGDRIGNVVVWLEDVRSGSALPLARRFEITNEDCRLEPRVQAVVRGGTLNLRSRDAVVHRTRILRHGSGEVLARVLHNDFGQVVPNDDVLGQAGLLELRSDVHPWTRAFIAVFDHPYFDVTGANGAFRIETIPAGSYTLAAWHERFGKVTQPITIGPGVGTTISLTFGTPTVAADSAAGDVTPSGPDTARPSTPAGR